MTPLESYPELAAAVGMKEILLKREDLHPYGSHKGRSIPVMIDRYVAAGDRRFAISSSGNAALAAALYVRELNAAEKGPIELDIFVGNHVAPHKLEKLKALADDSIRVLVKERPLQALTQAIDEGARSLRQSTDDAALIGYESLAKELAAEKKLASNGTAVFMGTSSGTTAQALAEYFSKNGLPIQVHIIQTSSCHPMADAFETYEGPDERSTAEAITDITARRKDTLVPLIKKTGGHGWVVTNDDIRLAQDLAKKHAKVDLSPNGVLGIAGAIKAATADFNLPSIVICIVGGE